MTPLAAFSRSGQSSPLGKLDERMDPYKIEGSVKEELTKQASALDLSLAEYMREVSRIVAFGRSKVKSLYAGRVALVGRKLDE